MTAINVIRKANTVHILSDGAFCDADGIVCELGPNAFPLPHIPAALAIRGPTHFMPFLVHRLSRECRSFDDVLARIIPVSLEVQSSFPMTFGTLGFGTTEPDFELVVVGWSTQRCRPESFLIANRERNAGHGLGHFAWRLIDLPDVLVAPIVSENQTNFVKWKVPDSAAAFAPEADGMKLLDAQRLSKMALSHTDPSRRCYTVGGFVQLTTVSSQEVSCKILHRWPDQLGQPIDPLKDRLYKSS